MNTTPTGESIQNLKREKNRGKVVASFDLVTSSGIRIPGFTLVKSHKELFVSIPSQKTSKGWQPLVKLPGYVKKELKELVIKEFDNLNKQKEKEADPAWKPPKLSPQAQKEADYVEWKKQNH